MRRGYDGCGLAKKSSLMDCALATDDGEGPYESHTAWDCDPFVTFEDEAYDLDLDEEDDEGDWQVLALDRWGDRIYVGYANSRY